MAVKRKRRGSATAGVGEAAARVGEAAARDAEAVVGVPDPGAVRRPLTYQQQAFVRELVRDWDVARAARAAGVSAGTAVKVGLNWLDPRVHPAVADELKRVTDRRLEESEVTAAEVVRELRSLAWSTPRGLCRPDGSIHPLHEMPDAVARTIRKIDYTYVETVNGDGEPVTARRVSVEFWDKLKAFELLMKHLGLLSPADGGGKDGGVGPQATVDWDRLATPVAVETVEDPVARRLREEEARTRAALPPHVDPLGSSHPLPPGTNGKNGKH